jgi:hypothetical protein
MMMTVRSPADHLDESSPRYFGWRVVAAAEEAPVKAAVIPRWS